MGVVISPKKKSICRLCKQANRRYRKWMVAVLFGCCYPECFVVSLHQAYHLSLMYSFLCGDLTHKRVDVKCMASHRWRIHIFVGNNRHIPTYIHICKSAYTYIYIHCMCAFQIIDSRESPCWLLSQLAPLSPQYTTNMSACWHF